MKKFTVFSGFLGAGKTSTMMALTKHFTQHHGKAAMISNDLGSQSLADHRLAVLAGCNASELTGNCICYQTENLVQRLDALFEDGAELVISDIPGFGVGALEHVYHTLNEKYSGRYELAPFTVLVEPQTARLLETGGDLGYILSTQLSEADLIVLNKCDLLSDTEQGGLVSLLERACPQAEVIPISARTGAGLEALSQALTQGRASMRRPDIGYGGQAFREAMGRISEFYIQYYVNVCCDDFDGGRYLLALAESVREEMARAGGDIPHLKLLAWEPEGDYGKADLLGLHRPTEFTKQFEHPVTELAVMLNGSAFCPGDVLEGIMDRVISEVSGGFNLEVTVFRKECFGMGGAE